MLDLGSSLIASVNRDPSSIALTYNNKSLTYLEWFKIISNLSNSLFELGLKKGDKILTVLQNNFEACTVHWSCQITGIIIVPINWRAKAKEIDFFVQDSEAKAIIFQDISFDEVQLSKETKKLIQITLDKKSNSFIIFKDLLIENKQFSKSYAKPEDISLILYTSGTTGNPKGVPRTHLAERSSAMAHVAQNLYERYESTLGVMPLYHTMGVRSLLAMSLVNGRFVVQPKFSASETLNLIENFKITSLYLVPTLFHDLIEFSSFNKERVISCKKLGFAGASMTSGLIKKIRNNFNAKYLVNHYGSSEIYTFTIEPKAFDKPGSAGKAGLNQMIRVVKINSNNPNDLTLVGEEGEIIANILSDESFNGYLKRPEINKKSIVDNWYFTKDTGYFDRYGDLYVTGRVDDMIISGGENISPIEIENTLSLHENVLEVVVVGLKDEKWGQKISAFVKCSKKIDVKSLDDHCKNSKLANFKRPKSYVFIKEIPKSPTGKILRRKILSGQYELDNFN